MIYDATGQNEFDPEERWANAYLSILKISSRTAPVVEDVWDTLTWCLEYALRLEKRRNSVQKEYLDEVGRVAMIVRHQYRTSQFKVDPFIFISRRVVVSSFLDIAAYFYMARYVRIAILTCSKEDILNAYSCISKGRDSTQLSENWIARKEALKDVAESLDNQLKVEEALERARRGKKNGKAAEPAAEKAVAPTTSILGGPKQNRTPLSCFPCFH